MDKNRRIAYQTLLDIEEKGAYSNLALNARIENQQADAPAFIRELVYGVLENKIYLDYVMSRYLKNKPEQLKARDRVLLRMGIYQLDFMDAVPAYAALNESVLLAKNSAKEGMDLSTVFCGIIFGQTRRDCFPIQKQTEFNICR